MERKKLTLTAHVLGKSDNEDEYEVTMLAGDNELLGLWFSAEEVGKASVAESFDGQPFNLDHSGRVVDEVGFLKRVWSENGNQRAVIRLTKSTAQYAVAKGFIENRLAAGKPPEVSVGVYLTVVEDEDNDRLLATDLEGDHLALVTRGECGPKDGCGIGLSRHAHECDTCPGAPKLTPKDETMTDEDINTKTAEHDEMDEECDGECDECQECTLTARVAELEAELEETQERLAEYEDRERDDLSERAEALGIDASEDLSELRHDVALAERVVAKHAKDDDGDEDDPEPKRKAKRMTAPKRGKGENETDVMAEAKRLLDMGRA